MVLVRQRVGKVRSLVHRVSRFIAVFSMVVLMQSAIAADAIPAYSGGQLELSEQEFQQNHPVVTSLMKKVNGVVTSDDIQWVKGHLNRQLYRVSQGHSSEAVYQFYVEAFKQQDVSPLFSCSSFACGGSNYWANDIFDIARLYGLDRYQFYFIGEKEGQYFSVYTVKRGNGRTYALIDQFIPDETAQPEVDHQDIAHQENWYLHSPLKDSKEVKTLIDALRTQPALSVVLQAQAVVPGSMGQLDQQHQFLKQQIIQLQHYITGKGIAPERVRTNIAVQGRGSLGTELPADTIWLRVFRLKQ